MIKDREMQANAPEPDRNASYRWLVVGMLWGICFFNYADRQALFSVFPLLQKEMDLSPLQLGMLGSAFAWVYGLGAPFAGWIVDRVRRKTAILGGLHAWSIICMATALSRTFRHLLFLRAAEGCGETFYYPASVSMISDYHAASTRSRALGTLVTSVYAGTIGGGFFAGLIGQRYGWRWSFVVFGGMGILLGLALQRFLAEPERGKVDQVAVASRLSAGETWRVIVRTPPALLLMAAFVCANFVAVVLLSWMPAFLYERFHMSLAMAGLNATLFAQIASMAGAAVGGWAGDAMAKRTVGGRILVQMAAVFAGAPFVVICGLTTSMLWMAVALAGWGLFKGMYDANIFASPFDFIPAQARGSMAGMMNCVGWLGGGGLAPIVVGAIAQRAGLGYAIAAASAVYCAAGLLLLAAVFVSTRRKAVMPLLGALLLSGHLAAAEPPPGKTYVTATGMKLVRIGHGSFRMGESSWVPDALLVPLSYPTREELQKRFPLGDPSRFVIPFAAFRHGDFDERPVHRVTISRDFFMSATEVTNAQYEMFDPAHRKLRGKKGVSSGDDEAVVFVTWTEATAYCRWLSKKENRVCRLPTEAEWEYACRAGTTSLYSTGDSLPSAFLKNASSTDFRSPADAVSLKTGATPPNPWGLFDMHGNVEEWTEDWYGPYEARDQTDPGGRVRGDFRVTRGGSYGTDPYYLRSANRMGALPETRSWLIGFRIVLADPPGPPLPAPPPARPKTPVAAGTSEPDMAKPYFRGPRRFVKIPADSHGPLYSHHNHDAAIAECPNGDLLAIWYTCEQERGRELAVAAARLPRGGNEWSEAFPFWDAPDRNDHCPALWFDGRDTLYHFNGYGLAGKWEPLAIVMRVSKDSGFTWSPARLIVPEFGFRNMIGQPVIRTRDGAIVFGADANRGSTIWVSRDRGATWADPGGNIAGIHAGVVQLSDGRLMALGRGQDVDGHMPMSISSDMGKTWRISASTLPAISGAQRLALIRLHEGPLLIASFASPPEERSDRSTASLFAALSFDEGKTWPVRRLITGAPTERGIATLDGGVVQMSATRSEPLGYLAITQARDGMIHLISSVNHYAFNLAWVRAQPPEATDEPAARTLDRRAVLPHTESGEELKRYAAGSGKWSTERSGGFDSWRVENGFTVEFAGVSAGTVLEVFARTAPLTVNRYSLTAQGPGTATYRLAVRDDTIAQLYRNGKFVTTIRPALLVDWRQGARGSYLAWSGKTGYSPVESVGLDPSGASQP